jgi:hypothetical protein
VASERPAGGARAAASRLRHWEPLATSAAVTQQSWAQPNLVQQGHLREDWRQHQQRAHSWQQQPALPSTSTADSSGHRYNAFQQNGWQQGLGTAMFMPMSHGKRQTHVDQHAAIMRQQQHQQQHQRHQQQQQEHWEHQQFSETGWQTHRQQHNEQPYGQRPLQLASYQQQQQQQQQPVVYESKMPLLHPWQDPAGSRPTYRSFTSSHEQGSHSATLAFVAAARERWRNKSR